MDYELLFLTISFLVATSFFGFVTWKKKSLPESISAMVYIFNGSWRWLWSVWLWFVTITLAFPLLEAMPEEWQMFAYFLLACLVFVGAFPLFDEEGKKYHYPLGIAAGGVSQVCVTIMCPWLWLCWIPVLASPFFGVKRDWICQYGVTIAECVCAMILFTSILIKLI